MQGKKTYLGGSELKKPINDAGKKQKTSNPSLLFCAGGRAGVLL